MRGTLTILITLVAVMLIACQPTGRPSWHSPQRAYRVTVDVANPVWGFREVPVEVPLDFTSQLARLEANVPFDPTSLLLVEVNSAGTVLDDSVPFQFDPDPGFEANSNASGTLILLVTGPDTTRHFRHYQLYFGSLGISYDIPNVTPRLKVNSSLEYRGQETVAIGTPAAAYYYHKKGGGLAGLTDPDGNEWIGYRPGGGSEGAFRGIPNLVHTPGYFHPGSTNVTTTMLSGGPLRIRLRSVSDDGTWACRWAFYPEYATMTLEKAGGSYWFMYEGTPGGSLDEQTDFMMFSDSTRYPDSQPWAKDMPAPEWIFFADGSVDRSLFIYHAEDDSFPDQYWPMEGNMTVFGFGREYPCCESYLTRVPAHFTIGLVDSRDYATIRRTLRPLIKPPEVLVGEPVKSPL